LGHAVGNVLPLAVAVAVFPVPVIAAVVVLGSDRGTAKGLAFVAGWCGGLAVVGAIALVFAGALDANEAGESATWVDLLLLGLGVLLLALAAKQWRGRPTAGEEMPRWMRTIGDFSVANAAGAGFALSGLNPKNVLLTVAAAAEIADVGLPAGQQVAVLVGFIVVASAGVLTPLVLAVALGERSREPLDRLRGWLARYNAVIMSVLFLVIGAKLIGDAVSGLSA
jgi:threonine/homoserine/homoserine lactone efflux protein